MNVNRNVNRNVNVNQERESECERDGHSRPPYSEHHSFSSLPFSYLSISISIVPSLTTSPCKHVSNNFIHMSTNQLQYVNFPQKGAVWIIRNPAVTGQMGEYCPWTRLQDGIVANQVHLVVLKFHSLRTFWRIGTDLHILPACRVMRMDTRKVLYSACPVSVITRESTIQSAFWISICMPLGAVAISANTHFTKVSELYPGSYHCFTRWASSTTKPTRYDWSMSFLNVICHFLFPRSCSFLFTVQP